MRLTSAPCQILGVKLTPPRIWGGSVTPPDPPRNNPVDKVAAEYFLRCRSICQKQRGEKKSIFFFFFEKVRKVWGEMSSSHVGSFSPFHFNFFFLFFFPSAALFISLRSSELCPMCPFFPSSLSPPRFLINVRTKFKTYTLSFLFLFSTEA